MSFLDSSNVYFGLAEDERIRDPEPEDEEPARALDLRINCVSASISIFDENNLLGQMQPETNGYDGSRPLLPIIGTREGREVHPERHVMESSPQPSERFDQRHQALPESSSQHHYSPAQHCRRSSESWVNNPSASFSRYLGPEKLWGNVELLEKQRLSPLSQAIERGPYAQRNRPSCQCSIPSCNQCFYSRYNHSPPNNFPSTAPRDRSRSPLSSAQNQNSRLSVHPDPSLVPNELFEKSPLNHRDDLNQSKYGGYIHKRFNAKSLFLSRILQRQQDHLNESGSPQQSTTKVEEDLDQRLQSAEEGFQSFSQSRQHMTLSNDEPHREENLGPQSLSRYSLSVSPPAVKDIDSKLNIIEKSLTVRDDLVKEMNILKKISDQRFSNVASRRPHFGSHRTRLSPPPRPQSTLPLNLSRENDGQESLPRTRSGTTSRTALQPQPPHNKSPISLRSPSPLSDEEISKDDTSANQNSIEKPGKSRRGRPRKHVRKIPLPPLYVFIRNLLHNNSYNPNIVSWVNESQGIFKVINTIEFAKTWGMMKSHRSEEMNYEKMSRAMRYHYGSPSRKGHLAMVKEKRLVYKFGELAVNWHAGEVPVGKCNLHDLCKGCLCLWTKE